MTVKKTVYVHIGAHKTGTTYLQTCLILNQAALAESGIDALADFAVWGQGHHNVALTYLDWALRDETRTREGYGRAFCDRIRDSVFPAVVVSSEFLELLDAGAISRFAADLGDCHTILVYWIRNQPQYLESFYLESHKQGLTEHFASWLQRRVEAGLGDFHGVASRWAKGMAANAVRIVVYDNLLLAGVNIFEFFARAILRVADTQALKFPSEPLINRTIDRRLRWLLQQLNRRHGQPESHAAGISAKYLQVRQRIERAYYGHPSLARGAERAHAIDAATAESIEAHFKPGNERLLREFSLNICNPTRGGRLFPIAAASEIHADGDIGPERAELSALLDLVYPSGSHDLAARRQTDEIDDFNHSRNLMDR